jgi:two-component system NarL family sensor kinase
MKRMVLTVLCCLPLLAAAAEKDSLYRELGRVGADTLAAAQLKVELGIAYYREGAYDSAMLLLTEGRRTADAARDKETLVKSLLNIGNVYADKGDNPLALKYYQEAMQTAEEVGDRKKMAHIRKNIGTLYLSWRRLDEALRCYQDALQEATALGDMDIMADCLNNMGTVYEQQEKYADALTVYMSALDYYRKTGRKARVAMALSNIAIVHKYQKNYSLSIRYNLQARDIAREIGDQWTEAAALTNVSSVYERRRDYRQAMHYSRLALDKAREIGAREIIVAVYENMAEIAYHAGDFRNAYRYCKELFAQKDSFINIERTHQLAELQVQYETEKKEKENAELKYENQLKTAAKERAERRTAMAVYVSLTAIVGLVLIALLVYRIQRIKARHREEQSVSSAMFDSEQKERSRIARDLHDSIGQMLSVIKMQLSQVDAPEDKAKLEQASRLVDTTIQEVRHISHNLLPEGLSFGLVRGLEEMALKINDAGGPAFRMLLSDEIREHPFAPETAFSIYRIIQEVTGNMLHHAEATEIRLDMYKKNAAIIISLSDNGKGFDPKVLEHSRGIGWKNIRLRVRFLNGTMQVQSAKGSGTQVTITIPS